MARTKFLTVTKKVLSDVYLWGMMGYEWDSTLTNTPGQYRVWVKYKGDIIYDVISDNYSTHWIIEDHIEKIRK